MLKTYGKFKISNSLFSTPVLLIQELLEENWISAYYTVPDAFRRRQSVHKILKPCFGFLNV